MLRYCRKNTVKISFTVFHQKRYRQKRENRLLPKRYRHVGLPSRPSPSKISLPNTSLIKIDEQWDCGTLCAAKMKERTDGEKGGHLLP